MPSDVHFLSRNNAFEVERRVTLTMDGGLRIAAANGEKRLPLSEIGLVELSAEESFASGVSYVCQIYRKRAWFPALTLKSKLYRGPNDFADTRADYRALMSALHGQIVKHAWPVKTQIAARPAALMHGLWSYAHWAFLIWVGAFIASLLALAWAEPPWVRLIPDVSFALACAAALGYLAWKAATIRGDYGPWPYDPRAIPEAVLPAPLGAD